MVVTLENQNMNAQCLMGERGLELSFADPAYVRSDMIVVHSSNAGQSLGAVLHEGYYAICALPQNVSIDDLTDQDTITLSSILPSGETFQLQAPLCVERI